MKPFKVLPCKDYTQINNQIKDFLKSETTLLEVKPELYANFVDIRSFVSKCPLFVQWSRDNGMLIRDAYFSYCGSRGKNFGKFGDTPCFIHLDKPPVHWKMNWPVLNMEGSCVRFFQTLDKTKDPNEYVMRDGDPDSKDHDYYSLDYRYFEETHRHDFDTNEPIIMDGLVPHDVGLYDNAEFPRIGLQVMFMKEPTHLL